MGENKRPVVARVNQRPVRVVQTNDLSSREPFDDSTACSILYPNCCRKTAIGRFVQCQIFAGILYTNDVLNISTETPNQHPSNRHHLKPSICPDGTSWQYECVLYQMQADSLSRRGRRSWLRMPILPGWTIQTNGRNRTVSRVLSIPTPQLALRFAWIARPTRKRTGRAPRRCWSASARKEGFAMATCAWYAKKAPSWHQTLRENWYAAPVLKVRFKMPRGNGNAFHVPSTRSAQRPGWWPPRSAKSVSTQYPFRPQMVPLALTT